MCFRAREGSIACHFTYICQWLYRGRESIRPRDGQAEAPPTAHFSWSALSTSAHFCALRPAGRRHRATVNRRESRWKDSLPPPLRPVSSTSLILSSPFRSENTTTNNATRRGTAVTSPAPRDQHKSSLELSPQLDFSLVDPASASAREPAPHNTTPSNCTLHPSSARDSRTPVTSPARNTPLGTPALSHSHPALLLYTELADKHPLAPPAPTPPLHSLRRCMVLRLSTTFVPT